MNCEIIFIETYFIEKLKNQYLKFILKPVKLKKMIYLDFQKNYLINLHSINKNLNNFFFDNQDI